MGRVCALQKTYGKTPSELETLVEGFAWAMQDFPVDTVIKAIGAHLLQSPTIPTPFEIRQIIDPIKKPWEPDKSYYFRLSKLLQDDGPYALNDEEISYMKKYEQHMRNAE